MQITAFTTAAVLSMSTGTGAYILTWAKISDPFRKWLPIPWLRDLFACPFCVAVWESIFATLIYRPLLVRSGAWPLDYLTTALAIAGASMATVRLIGSALGRYAPKPAQPLFVPVPNGAHHEDIPAHTA